MDAAAQLRLRAGRQAAGGPAAETDAASQLRLGADRQAPNGCRFGPDQMFRNGRLGRCHELLSLVRDADADARVHAATSGFAYGPLPCAPGRLTVPAVIPSSPRVSDGTRSG